MIKKKYWIYMLLCENGSLYTGYTTDMARRYQQHCNGTGRAKYTLSFKPIKIARCWQLTGTRGSALRIEQLIKGRNRKEKEYLVENPEELSTIIQDELGLDTTLLVVNPELIEKEISPPHTDDAELRR
jgi:putative endonuclease